MPQPSRSRPTTAPKQPRTRIRKQLLSPDGRLTVLRLGETHSPWRDVYHQLLTMSWLKFLGLLLSVYIATNVVFALAYLVGADNIANARPGSLVDTFFFSVQTLATIGYGALYPKTFYANVLVAIEALVGLLGVAMATGLMFARFSRPTARLLFSKTAVIVPYDGVPTLMFRAANERGNQILEARIWVTLIREEKTSEGHTMRRIRDMKLIRSQSPFFILTWTAMHPIDEDSPLYGETPESMADSDAEILVTLTGIDETVAQPVNARYLYPLRQLYWNHQLADVFSVLPTGDRVVDYSRFHDVVPMPE